MNYNPAELSALAKGDVANFVAATTPGGIEAQEAKGQRDMAENFTALPKQMDRAIAETFGFAFGEDADDIFVSVKAPSGWHIRPTDHSMHSDIVDDKGRVRGGIFYKAAFYDRRADGHWAKRYQVKSDYGEDGIYAVHVVDNSNGKTLRSWDTPLIEGQNRWDRGRAEKKEAQEYLANNYPDFNNPVAYW